MKMDDSLIKFGQELSSKNPTDEMLIEKINEIMASSVDDVWKWDALEFVDVLHVNRFGGISSPVTYALADAFQELLDG